MGATIENLEKERDCLYAVQDYLRAIKLNAEALNTADDISETMASGALRCCNELCELFESDDRTLMTKLGEAE